ncbi:MAG: hypothetical protein OEZ31_11930 [Nitrospirota bacterium]|nr:hypothetical protein [Candidatus Aminicenantes bacterium]MDH5769645.1 hypothetical protein [Nitrospirota bacterium]
MKKILITSFIILFLFLNANGFAIEKSKKVKFGLYLINYFSTSFKPESMKQSIDYASVYSNVALYLIDRILIQGSTGYPLDTRICLNYDEEELYGRGRVYLPISESFLYKPGDVFPITQERYFNLSRRGIPFQIGLDIPLSKKWCVGLNYYQSRNFHLEQIEKQDYITIDTLERIPLSDGKNSLWEMYFLRTYEERTNTFTFQNMGVEASLEYELLTKSKRLSLSPEAGVSLGFLKRKLKEEIGLYGYTRSMFPELVWPDTSLEIYRELRESEETEESSSKFKTRFFAGINAEFYPVRFLGVYCTARIYNKSITQEYLESSVLNEFPFDLKITQFLVSVGVTLNISSIF